MAPTERMAVCARAWRAIARAIAVTYGKVYSQFWTDEKVRAYSVDAKLLALYLLTGPHRNLIGCYRLPIGYVTDDMQWTADRVVAAITELATGERPFLARDQAGWTAIINAIRYEKYTSPNHYKAADFLLCKVPQQSPIFQIVASALAAVWRDDWVNRPKYLEATPDLLSSSQEVPTKLPFTPAPAPSPCPSPLRENPKKDSLVSEAADDPIGNAVGLYLQLAEKFGWPQIADGPLANGRRTKLLARLRECGGLDGWRIAMDKASRSSFLTGRSGRSNGHEHWKPNLDFFLRQSSFQKLMEGAYDDRQGGPSPDSGGSGFAGVLAEARARSSERGESDN